MTLTVDGVNIAPYIAYKGFTWQRSDVDGPNAGRAIGNGTLYRDRLSTKVRLDITCTPLELKDVSKVLKAIAPEYVTVTYTDPQEGQDVTKVMFSNNIPVPFLIKREDGRDLWGGFTFPLIER